MIAETNYSNYRTFLQSRYEEMKVLKPAFSARYFARKAGIASISYFRMVVTGERRLSAEYAKKIAKGLSLSQDETKFLLKSVELDNTHDPALKDKLASEIQILIRHLSKNIQTLNASHVEILSDLINLKLYLLAQNHQFKADSRWIEKRFKNELSLDEIEKRMGVLLHSGLWKLESGKVKILAPVVRTGDFLEEKHLAKTHLNILTAAQKAINIQSSHRRIFGGRTFLFDKKKMKEVSKRIEEFKSQLEAEFEDLEAEEVYELHISFFEL